MIDAIELLIKIRKDVMAWQAVAPSVKAGVTIGALPAGFPNKFTVDDLADLGGLSWESCLVETRENDAYPSVRVISSHSAGSSVISMLGAPIIGDLAVGDDLWVTPGPLKTAHIAVNSFSKAAQLALFKGNDAPADPMGILLRIQDFSSSFRGFDGSNVQGSATVDLRFVMLGHDSVMIRNTMLVAATIEQFLTIVDKKTRSSRQRGSVRTSGTDEGTRLSYTADIMQTTDESLEKAPVIVGMVEFPVNFT